MTLDGSTPSRLVTARSEKNRTLMREFDGAIAEGMPLKPVQLEIEDQKPGVRHTMDRARIDDDQPADTSDEPLVGVAVDHQPVAARVLDLLQEAIRFQRILGVEAGDF